MAHPTVQVVRGGDGGSSSPPFDFNQMMAMMVALRGQGMDAKAAERAAQAQMESQRERTRGDVAVANINKSSGVEQQNIQAKALTDATRLRTKGDIALETLRASLLATSSKVSYDREMVGKAIDDYQMVAAEAASGIIPQSVLDQHIGLQRSYALAYVQAETDAANAIGTKINAQNTKGEKMEALRDAYQTLDEMAGKGGVARFMGEKAGIGFASAIVAANGDITAALGKMGPGLSKMGIHGIVQEALTNPNSKGFSKEVIESLTGDKGAPEFGQSARAMITAALNDPRITNYPEAVTTLAGALANVQSLPGAQDDRVASLAKEKVKAAMTLPDGSPGLNMEALRSMVTAPIRTKKGLDMFLKEADNLAKQRGVRLPIELYRKELSAKYLPEYDTALQAARVQVGTETALDARDLAQDTMQTMTENITNRYLYGRVVGAQARLKAVAELVPGNPAIEQALAEATERAKLYQPAEPGEYNAWEDIIGFRQKLEAKKLSNVEAAKNEAERRYRSIDQKLQTEITNKAAQDAALQTGPMQLSPADQAASNGPSWTPGPPPPWSSPRPAQPPVVTPWPQGTPLADPAQPIPQQAHAQGPPAQAALPQAPVDLVSRIYDWASNQAKDPANQFAAGMMGLPIR